MHRMEIAPAERTKRIAREMSRTSSIDVAGKRCVRTGQRIDGVYPAPECALWQVAELVSVIRQLKQSCE